MLKYSSLKSKLENLKTTETPLFLPPYPVHLGFTYKAMSCKYPYLFTYFTYIQL